jgi:hypothetical protein
VKSTVDPIKFPYYPNGYLFLNDKNIPWDRRNFKVLNLIKVYPETNAHHAKHNQKIKELETFLDKNNMWSKSPLRNAEVQTEIN